MGPELIVKHGHSELSEEAARIVARQLLLTPDSVLGLPTGDTPEGMYRVLVQLHRNGFLDFSKATTFNLDEYLGIPPDHPQSFSAYMRRRLWDHVNLAKDKVHMVVSRVLCKGLCTEGIPLLKHPLQHLLYCGKTLRPPLRPPPLLPLRLQVQKLVHRLLLGKLVVPHLCPPPNLPDEPLHQIGAP